MHHKIRILLLLGISLCMIIQISSYSICFAAPQGTIKSQLTVFTGMEHLEYREYEPDNEVTSIAEVRNHTAGLEGIKVWTDIFVALRGVFPVLKGLEDETWAVSGTQRQINDLEYGWTRLDGFIGFPDIPWLTVYGGLRLSEGRQKRSNFVVLGSPKTMTSTEIVRSRSILLGLRGSGRIVSRWSLAYRMEGFVPLAVEVTNSAFPGFGVTRKKGYAFEVEGGIKYHYSNHFMFGVSGYGGRMHWAGSEWQPYGAGFVKWPENDTDYLGGLMKLEYFF